MKTILWITAAIILLLIILAVFKSAQDEEAASNNGNNNGSGNGTGNNNYNGGVPHGTVPIVPLPPGDGSQRMVRIGTNDQPGKALGCTIEYPDGTIAQGTWINGTCTPNLVYRPNYVR